MKKISVIVVLIALVACLVSCNESNVKESVTITFVTGCELTIDPIVVDGKEEKYMPENPMRAGYEFLGWYYDQSFFVPFKTSDPITNDITLYAKWLKKSGGTEVPDEPIETAEGIVYRSEGDFYAVTGYNGSAESIVIPARVSGAPVMKICSGAFKGTTLKRISFGRNIETVENGAFGGADNLSFIEVEDGSVFYKDIDGILYNKKGDVLICVPAKIEKSEVNISGVAEITPYAFENCVCSVTFSGKAYENIEGYAFANFAGEIYLSDKVKEIRKDAFYGATCEILFEAGFNIKELRNGAFAGYAGEKIILPSSVTTVEWQAFDNCTATVDLSRTYLTEIGEKAFAGYRGEVLVIPASVSKIGKNAFYGARTNITFEEGSLYTEIAELTFSGFGGSDAHDVYSGTVTFPSSVKTVKANAFYGSYSNVHFTCAEEEAEFDGAAFNSFKGKYDFATTVAK